MPERRIIVQLPGHPLELLVLGALALIVVIASWSNLLLAFSSIGLPLRVASSLALLIPIASLAASPFNIPVARVETQVLVPTISYSYLFGLIPVPRPAVEVRIQETVLAVNVGGCIAPLMISALLVGKCVTQCPLTAAAIAISVLLVAVVTKPSSRVIPGVGVVTPAIIPPLAAAVFTIISCAALRLPAYTIPPVAYVSGTLGALIGADILNLKRVLRMGARLVSIGGAGSFDGIYLSGVLAIGLAALLVGL